MAARVQAPRRTRKKVSKETYKLYNEYKVFALSKNINDVPSENVIQDAYWIVYLLLAALWGNYYKLNEIESNAPAMRKYLKEYLTDEYPNESDIYSLIISGLEEISETHLDEVNRLKFRKDNLTLIDVLNACIDLWDALVDHKFVTNLDISVSEYEDDIIRATKHAFEDMYNFELKQQQDDGND